MKEITGEYWKTTDNIVRIQIKTAEEQKKLEEALPGWRCVSYGYIPKTSEDIYVFERRFESEKDWTRFLKSDNINKLLDIREVKND